MDKKPKLERKDTKERIKELEKEVADIRKTNEQLLQQVQVFNQRVNQNSAQIIKRTGAIEELKRY